MTTRGKGMCETEANPLPSHRKCTSMPSDPLADQTPGVNGSLSDDALRHLKAYKYSSVDKSYLSRYILRHYWNGFVELLPLWLAPNMVTLLGFFFILANVALLVIFMPDLVGPVRRLHVLVSL